MSAPNSQTAEATYLSYGFLAAKASTFLERLLDKTDGVDDDVKESLAKAEQFLNAVASGATLWAAAGFTDTEFGCDDETGGGPWEREEYSAASTSLRL